MGSDLYVVSVLDKQPQKLTLHIQCIHPDVLYVADDPGFALMLLHSAIPYDADTPLGDEVSLDDLMDPDWAWRYARGFIRAVRAFDEENPCPPAARNDPHHPYWESPQNWLSWKLELELSHPTWIDHIADNSSWESRAFSPVSDYKDHPEPIEPEVSVKNEDSEGMFVWVPRACFADMTPDWSAFPELMEMPAYPENHYIFEPALTEIDARWLGRPIFVKGPYNEAFGAVALIPDAKTGRQTTRIAILESSGQGYSGIEQDDRCHTVSPRVVKRPGAKLAYDTILDSIHTTVTHIHCQDSRVTFTLRRPPHGGKATPIETESDALNLLMGADWKTYFRDFHDTQSALTRSVIADGVTLGIETEYRVKEVIPFVAKKYVRSFDVILPEESSPLPRLDDLSHAEAHALLLRPWPEATVTIEVTDPSWLEHLPNATLPFPLYAYPLAAPSEPPLLEKQQEAIEEDLCDERVTLWRNEPACVTWSAERHGALLKTRWGARHNESLRENEKTFDSDVLAAKHLEKQVKKKLKEGYYALLSPADAATRMKAHHGVTFSRTSPPTIADVPDPAEDTKDYGKLRTHDVITGVGVQGGKRYSHVHLVEELLAALELAQTQGKRSEYVWFYRPASSTYTSVNFDLTQT